MKDTMIEFKFMKYGAVKMLPIIPGVIPFGLIMGGVASSNNLTLFETMSLNFSIYAGASQLAVMELLSKGSPTLIIILTGLIINLRFIMYSTAMAPLVEKYDPLKKIGLAYFLTDQSYAVTNNEMESLASNSEKVSFYLGTSLCMTLFWQLSTFVGFIFGDFAPPSMSLDFVVPLAFMSLIIPSLKNRIFVTVAMTSFCLSVVFHDLPYNLGLIVSATFALVVGILLELKISKEEVMND
jgi:predicted branched-subunit amino acid permease